jgi:hypothetical protein
MWTAYRESFSTLINVNKDLTTASQMGIWVVKTRAERQQAEAMLGA